jgi:hypothetical protein
MLSEFTKKNNLILIKTEEKLSASINGMVHANILGEQSGIVDKEWSSEWSVGRWFDKPSL